MGMKPDNALTKFARQFSELNNRLAEEGVNHLQLALNPDGSGQLDLKYPGGGNNATVFEFESLKEAEEFLSSNPLRQMILIKNQ